MSLSGTAARDRKRLIVCCDGWGELLGVYYARSDKTNPYQDVAGRLVFRSFSAACLLTPSRRVNAGSLLYTNTLVTHLFLSYVFYVTPLQ